MKILLLDGNSVLNRAYYGIRPLTTTKGLHTNAVYGFLAILLRHIADEKPDAIYAAFDLKAPTFRHIMYDGYKAGRHETPPELLEQFPVIKKVLDALGVLRIEQPGMEADDIIGVLSKKYAAQGDECVIITGDRDELQLVQDNITVKLAVTKSTGSSDDVYTPEKINEKYGLAPERLIDLKALMGDASDNIPGVAGVGEKTALTLLHDYGTLDGVYAHVDEVKGKLKEKLMEGKESAYMSRTLGTIMTTAPDGVSFPSPTDAKEKDCARLRELFTELEMPSMFERFGLNEQTPADGAVDAQAPVNIEEYDPKKHIPENEIYALSDEDGYLVKFGDTAAKLSVTQALDLFDGANIVTHDAKPLLKAMFSAGKTVNAAFDTMLAGYILNPSKSAYPLATLYIENMNRNVTDTAAQLMQLPDLRRKMTEAMKNDGSYSLYADIDLPLSAVLARMEVSGVEADAEFLHAFGEKLDADIAAYTSAIYEYAGKEFNINSPKQLGTVLFEDLFLPCGRKTKIGYATDNDTLEKLLPYHPIIENIISYRKLTKLKSTYVEGLLRAILPDGRIHTVFTQTVTQTGRISSIEPNLQNIPVRTELGRELRRAFRAKDGFVLVDADYSQIELRIMAHISGDPTMQQIFRENTDIHTRTAAEVFGLPEQMVSAELRRRAKAINFGIIYGIGDYSLSQDIGVTRKEARQYINNYLEAFPRVKDYLATVISDARNSGYVTTLFGRRRYVPELSASNKMTQAFGERVCMNTPIQGTAADLIKLAMIKVSKRLEKENMTSRLILQIHDELILEAPENEAEKAAEILREEMENAYTFDVPLVTEVHTGKTWYDTKD